MIVYKEQENCYMFQKVGRICEFSNMYFGNMMSQLCILISSLFLCSLHAIGTTSFPTRVINIGDTVAVVSERGLDNREG